MSHKPEAKVVLRDGRVLYGYIAGVTNNEYGPKGRGEFVVGGYLRDNPDVVLTKAEIKGWRDKIWSRAAQTSDVFWIDPFDDDVLWTVKLAP
jgi:hypothetical protein